MLGNQQLPFAYCVHDFNPRDGTPRTPERFEAEHRSHYPLYGSMILLHDIIEVFGVADNDGGLVNLVVVFDRRRVAATLIDGDFLRQSLIANSFE